VKEKCDLSRNGNQLIPVSYFMGYKCFFRLLVLNNLLFSGLYCLLLFFNRYAADDYYTVFNARTRGILGSTWYIYQTWTPRPAAVFLSSALTGHFQERSVLIGYGLIVLFLLATAAFKLLQFFCKKAEIHFSNFVLFNFSALFCCAFFFSSVSIAETWFWFCSSIAYLFSLAAFLWGLVFLLNGKTNVINSVALSVCLVYVMGAAESFGVFVMLLCVAGILLFIYRFRKNTRELKNSHLFKMLFSITCFSLIALSFIYFGTGTQSRKAMLRQAAFIETFYLPARTMIYLFILKIPTKLPLLVLFSIPFSWAGNQLKNNLLASLLFTSKSLRIACVGFLVLSYSALLPACYIMADRGPERSFTINSFLLVLLFIYLFAYLGYKIKDKRVMLITASGLSLSSGLLIFSIVWQLNSAPLYANAVDKRIEVVKAENKKGRTASLDLEPLPPNGFYYSAELSPDTNFYNNVFFRKGLGLNFSCRVNNGIYH